MPSIRLSRISTSSQSFMARIRTPSAKKGDTDLEELKQSGFKTLDWKNHRYLTDSLLDILDEHDSIRSKLYPRPGEVVTGKTKSDAYQRLVRKTLEQTELHAILEGNDKAAVFYGRAFKNRLMRLEKSYKEAKDILGVTGAGLASEEEIWEGPQDDEIRNRWEAAKAKNP